MVGLGAGTGMLVGLGCFGTRLVVGHVGETLILQLVIDMSTPPITRYTSIINNDPGLCSHIFVHANRFLILNDLHDFNVIVTCALFMS